MRVDAWTLHSPGAAMLADCRDEEPADGEVLVRVAGCAVRSADLAIFAGEDAPRTGLPLTLGSEIAGRVVAAGRGAEAWRGHDVVIPSALPCSECDACRSGRSSLCGRAVLPGRSTHGGFASHVRVPAQGLCLVPFLADREANPARIDLATLAVVADTVTAPFQAVARSGLIQGDVAVFIGIGVRGALATQIAAARGASVIAIDLEAGRLKLATELGAELTLRADAVGVAELRRRVDSFAASKRCPSWRVRIFETSGTDRGLELAFELLGPGRSLVIVGSAADHVRVRLSRLVGFGATVFGSSGCEPDLYPTVLKLVLAGKIKLSPLVECRPLGTIHRTFEELLARREQRRVVLVPG